MQLTEVFEWKKGGMMHENREKEEGIVSPPLGIDLNPPAVAALVDTDCGETLGALKHRRHLLAALGFRPKRQCLKIFRVSRTKYRENQKKKKICSIFKLL